MPYQSLPTALGDIFSLPKTSSLQEPATPRNTQNLSAAPADAAREWAPEPMDLDQRVRQTGEW